MSTPEELANNPIIKEIEAMSSTAEGSAVIEKDLSPSEAVARVPLLDLGEQTPPTELVSFTDLTTANRPLTSAEQDTLRAFIQDHSARQDFSLPWQDAAWKHLLTEPERQEFRILNSEASRTGSLSPRQIELYMKMGYDAEKYGLNRASQPTEPAPKAPETAQKTGVFQRMRSAFEKK